MLSLVIIVLWLITLSILMKAGILPDPLFISVAETTIICIVVALDVVFSVYSKLDR